ncbi:MAG: efflux RND transporter periplasmic adaptor subunit [Desulfobacterales bacterium]|nr:efflux RND transporter periplasmic adaptor subunit [Desulfobacterales bacterium]
MKKWMWMGAVLGLLWGCAEAPVQEELIRPVRYEQVFRVLDEKVRTFSGVSESGREVAMSFRISGVIQKIHVVVGQRLKPGDVVARVDNAEAVLDHEKALAAEKNAKVQVETAKSNLERVRGLYESDTVPLSEYEEARNKYAAARSEYSASRKNTALKKRELTYYTLYAPMAGIVVSKDVNENEVVASGTQVVKLSSEKDIRVSVGVPEKYIAHVQTRSGVSVTFSSLPGRLFRGVVTEISYAGGTASTYPVTVALNPENGLIRPGMPASVSFAFGQGENRGYFIVPPNAVGEDTQGNFVFVVSPGAGTDLGVVARKEVTVGKLTDKGFQIISGLAEGDRVITSGVTKMVPGKRVKFIN